MAMRLSGRICSADMSTCWTIATNTSVEVDVATVVVAIIPLSAIASRMVRCLRCPAGARPMARWYFGARACVGVIDVSMPLASRTAGWGGRRRRVVAAAVGRYEQMNRHILLFSNDMRLATEVAVAVWVTNRMLEPGRLISVQKSERMGWLSGCETSLAFSAIMRALVMSQGPARPAGLFWPVQAEP